MIKPEKHYYEQFVKIRNQLSAVTATLDTERKELAVACEDRDAAVLRADLAENQLADQTGRANAYAGQVEKLYKELDECQNQLAAVTAERNSLQVECEEWREVGADFKADIAKVREERDAAQAACGEMRSCLIRLWNHGPNCPGIQDSVDHCLATDRGKGFVPVAELDKWHVDNCPYAKRLADEQALKGGKA